MNPRENANESLRLNRGAYALLLMISISASGCAIASETGRVFFLAKRSTQIEPRSYRYIRSDRQAQQEARRLGEQAWGDYAGANANTNLSPDFENGFVEGFADYLYRGGSGEPPLVPPRGYWNLRFLNQFGKASINEWYKGFRQGAQDCKSRGIRDMWVISTSLLSNEVKQVITQPDQSWTLPRNDPGATDEALATPPTEPEAAESSLNVARDSDSERGELDLQTDPLDASEPPVINLEGLEIDDSLSIRKVQPATRIPARSQPATRSPEVVISASNQTVAQAGAATREETLTNAFRNVLRQSKSNGNQLRIPADTASAERLRLVFEPGAQPVATIQDELDDVPVIPLEINSPPVENQSPLPNLSAATSWQANGRSQELPLKIRSSSAKTNVKQAAPPMLSEQGFDKLEMLLNSTEDAAQLPRIVHKPGPANVSPNDSEATDVIRWRIRD